MKTPIKLFLATITLIPWNGIVHGSSKALSTKTESTDSLDLLVQPVAHSQPEPTASQLQEQKRFLETEVFNPTTHLFNQKMFMPHLPHLYKETINTVVINSDSLLAFFIKRGQLDIITELLELGADPNHVVPYTNGDVCYFFDEPMVIFHETPLTTAIFYNQTEALQRLLNKKADPNLPNGGGITPLMRAAEIGSIKKSEILLAAGAQPNVQDNKGNTALLYIRELLADPATQCLINLLVKHGGNPKIANKKGETVLTKARKDIEARKQRYAVEGYFYQKEMIELLERKIITLESGQLFDDTNC